MDRQVLQQMILQLKTELHRLHVIDDTDFEQLSKMLRVKKIIKGDVILKVGKACSYLWLYQLVQPVFIQ